jgi:hypothetical protein
VLGSELGWGAAQRVLPKLTFSFYVPLILENKADFLQETLSPFLDLPSYKKSLPTKKETLTTKEDIIKTTHMESMRGQSQ